MPVAHKISNQVGQTEQLEKVITKLRRFIEACDSAIPSLPAQLNTAPGEERKQCIVIQGYLKLYNKNTIIYKSSLVRLH